jgi:two-component system, NarL family, response regulator NreC
MRKVVLAQHHSDLRHGLREILQRLPEVSVIGTTATGHELLAQCRQAAWDVAILDLRLPGENPIEIVRTMLQECPSFTLEPDRIRLCLSLGVAGYLASENVPDEMGDAVASVLKGATYLSRAAAQALIDDSQGGWRAEE